MSHWFNTKAMDLCLAATTAEHEAFVADVTPYALTSREVALTGFPRHDELLRMPNGRADSADLPLIVPTWRNSLVRHASGGGNQRVLVDGFWESDYATEWFGLLKDPLLRQFATDSGLTIAFAPHPPLQGHLPPTDVPDGVRLVSYEDDDIKEMIARARIAITDYSSLGTEAAYAGVPVVYFQFDRDEFYASAHIYRRGYFDTERDGFGPVALDRTGVITSLDRLTTDPEFAAPYLARIDSTFRYRDERNSERAFRAIQALDVPWHERDRSLFDGTTTEYDPAAASGADDRSTSEMGSESGGGDPIPDLAADHDRKPDLAPEGDRAPDPPRRRGPPRPRPRGNLTMTERSTPVITLISAVYNVAEYLPAFLGSL